MTIFRRERKVMFALSKIVVFKRFGLLRQMAARSPTLNPSQPTRSVSPPVGCYHPHPPSPFVIVTQPDSWYSFSAHGGWKAESTRALQKECAAPAHGCIAVVVLTAVSFGPGSSHTEVIHAATRPQRPAEASSYHFERFTDYDVCTQLHYVRCLTASATRWPAVIDKGCSEVIYATVHALPNGLTATPYWLERPMRIRSVQNTAAHLVSGAIGARPRYAYSTQPPSVPVPQRVIFKTAIFVQKCVHGFVPASATGALRRSGKCPRSFMATVCIDWALASSLDYSCHQTSTRCEPDILQCGTVCRQACATTVSYWTLSNRNATFWTATNVIQRCCDVCVTLAPSYKCQDLLTYLRFSFWATVASNGSPYAVGPLSVCPVCMSVL